MKIFVKAKPNSREEKIEKIDPPSRKASDGQGPSSRKASDGQGPLSPSGFGRASEMHFVVFIKEPPIQGRANRAIIKLLADYFKTDISRVRIVSGAIARNKIIEIL